jgi:hypothetical protein
LSPRPHFVPKVAFIISNWKNGWEWIGVRSFQNHEKDFVAVFDSKCGTKLKMEKPVNSRFTILALGLMAVVGVLVIVLFPGSPEQDTDYHFLMARTAWVDPSYLVNVWARPLFTTLYAPIALLGYTAARCFALGISLVAAWQTCRLASDLEMPRPWLVVPILLGQPVFFELFTDLFTETLFALVFVLAVRCHLSGRTKAGMLIASLLPLARPEGVFVCVLWGVLVLFRPGASSGYSPLFRRVFTRIPSVLILALGVVMWWFAALLITGDPFFILHDWPATWRKEMYGHGTFLSYAERGFEFTGGLLVIPCIVGLFYRWRSSRWLLITSAFLLFFVLHSIFRKFGLLGEAGYPRYMVSVAPATAVLTLQGWNLFRLMRIPRVVLVAGGWLVLVLSFLTSLLYIDTMTWARDPVAIDDMVDWLKQHPKSMPGLIWSNGRMCTDLGRNLQNSPQVTGPEALIMRLKTAPSGTIVFWDDHIGPDWFGLTAADIEKQGYERLISREYLVHAVLYPDSGFERFPWLPVLGQFRPRKIELSLLQKP